jgi:hypothetical protein
VDRGWWGTVGRERVSREDQGRGGASTRTGGKEEPNQEESNAVLAVGAQSKSSWVQRLDEIPYEDMIAAQSVNAFMLLILCRELLPLLGSDAPAKGTP